jgi:hypothetical protein
MRKRRRPRKRRRATNVQASTVILERSTQATASRPLGMKRRTEMKREAVKAYIRSKPTGEPINLRQMGKSIGLFGAQLQTFPGFLLNMANRGDITMEGEKSKRSRVFTVVDDVKTTIGGGMPKSVEEPVAELPTVELPAKDNTAGSLLDYAQRFAWEQDSDSLRSFVAWMEGSGLVKVRVEHE